MNRQYEDIIHLPYPFPTERPRMSMADRAAQFSPFAALTGYDSAIQEAGRLTDIRLELSEDEKSALDLRQQYLQEHLSQKPKITLTCFIPDERKEGGSYETITGYLKKIDNYHRLYIFTDGTSVAMDSIFKIDGEFPE